MLSENVTEYSVPSLSVIRMPNAEIGSSAIDLMQKMISHQLTGTKHIREKSELIYRESFLKDSASHS